MVRKAIVLFSGGLDSRLVVKIMQEKGYEVIALHFNLPFGCGCCNFGCNFKFTQISGVKFKIFDVSKGKLLKEYLEILKKAKHGRGAGVNPCKDCKIFMFKKAKEYADKHKIKVIATGEVVGQRPMSQTERAMKVIDKEIGFELQRPLIDLGIKGRRRDKQMALAKKYNIRYPMPGGGCLLCEKALKNRFMFLVNRGLNAEEIKLSNVGRHFIIDKCWIVLGRDESENKVIEKLKTGELIIPEKTGPSAIILGKKPEVLSLSKSTQSFKQDKCSKKIKEKVNAKAKTISKKTIEKVKELISAYSKGGDRKKFKRYLL